MNVVRVTRGADGGAVLEARDWPLAPVIALALMLPSLPLLIWSIAERRAVEGGGAALLCGIALFVAALALRGRRRVRFAPGRPIRVSAELGAGPFRRQRAFELAEGAHVAVRPLPCAPGAHTEDRQGADLVLVDRGGTVHLARRIGSDRRDLEAARAALSQVLGGG
jgi:hypothetical protein